MIQLVIVYNLLMNVVTLNGLYVESFGSTYVAEVIGLQDLHTFKCSLQGVKAGGSYVY